MKILGARQPRRPNGSAHHPTRSVRISDEVWEAAKSRAEQDGYTMSRVVAVFVEGYADGQFDLPQVTVSYRNSRPTTTSESPTRALAPETLQKLGLVRVVDVKLPRAKHADPKIFDLAMFEDQTWEDVGNVRDLLARIAPLLWNRDSDLLESTQNGSKLVTREKKKGQRYIELAPGVYLRNNWATHYRFAALQEFITAFNLDDRVWVKPYEVRDA